MPCLKKEHLRQLARKRADDGLRKLSKHYMQVDELDGGIYSSWELVSPWSKSAFNTDSRLMVIGQDWTSYDPNKEKNKKKELTFGMINGWDPAFITNKNLQILLNDCFNLSFADIYATNLFVFVKIGDASAYIPMKDLKYSAENYTKKEIDIVKPEIILCLGVRTFEALRKVLSSEEVIFKDSLQSPINYQNCKIYGVPHTGFRGINNAGGLEGVKKIWKTISKKHGFI